MKQSAVIYTKRVPARKFPDPPVPRQHVPIWIKNRGFLDCIRDDWEVVLKFQSIQEREIQMSQFPKFSQRPTTILDGVWDFAYLGPDIDLTRSYRELVPDRYLERAPVPGCFDTLPQYAGCRGTACYRTRISVTPGAKGLLRFAGTGLWIRVYVDAQKVFEGSYPYCPLDVEVPPAETDARDLVILVDNRFDPDRVPLFEPFFDFYAYGGIYRSIELQEVPSTYIQRLEVTPMDVELGLVRLALVLTNTDDRPLKTAVSFDGGPEAQIVFDHGDGRHTVELRVPEPRLWSTRDPQLHRVKVRIDGDCIEERFGLRVVEAAHGEIRLNGEPVKLLGVCRHESHPQFGPALPLGQLVQDLALVRGLGCNFVRGVHYPQDQRFLELCDEMGILVFEESLGWGQRDQEFYERDSFRQEQLTQTKLMIERSYNHPSVILWGFMNECASKEEYARDVYTQLVSLVRELDGSRLVTYASMFPFDDLYFEQVDVISVNQYPAWYSGESSRPLEAIPERLNAITEHLAKTGLSDKPVIVSEIGAGAIYGWRDPHHGRWSEEYQKDYLTLVCQEIVERPEYAGIALWQYCDARTFDNTKTLTRPRGFNNKGLFDEYRRPKLAVESVKRIFRGNTQNSGKG